MDRGWIYRPEDSRSGEEPWNWVRKSLIAIGMTQRGGRSMEYAPFGKVEAIQDLY